MDLEVAEPSRERDVLLRGQRLVAEEDDLVVVQRLAQLGDDLVGQRGREIDAGDLGPHRRAELAGVEWPPAAARPAGPAPPPRG